MSGNPRPWQPRDWRFAGLIATGLVCIALVLAERGPGARPGEAGWRRIDTAALLRRVDSGDLSRREAEWQHPARPGDRPPPRGGEAMGEVRPWAR